MSHGEQERARGERRSRDNWKHKPFAGSLENTPNWEYARPGNKTLFTFSQCGRRVPALHSQYRNNNTEFSAVGILYSHTHPQRNLISNLEDYGGLKKIYKRVERQISTRCDSPHQSTKVEHWMREALARAHRRKKYLNTLLRLCLRLPQVPWGQIHITKWIKAFHYEKYSNECICLLLLKSVGSLFKSVFS